MKNKNLLLISLLLTASVLRSQPISVNSQTYTPQQLVANVLIGGGIQVSNIVYTGSSLAIGYFDAFGSSFDTIMHTGIAMTNGSIINMVGPNNSSGITTNQNLPGDSDLSALITPFITYDASVIEFDFIPQTDSIQLRYVFGSDEYPEYVFSNFNDAFGFFLTGPDPSGGNYSHYNIALIPGTNTPVSINSINASTNSNYYISNGTGSTPDNEAIQYDGYTKGLKAFAHVVPFATYHIKLAVADAGDHVLDSGIFLEAGSFTDGILIPVPLSVIPVVNNVSCNNLSDGSVTLTVYGGQTPYNYLWSTGATTAGISGLSAGTYTVTVSSTSVSPLTQSFVITQPSQLNVSISITGSFILSSSTTGGIPPYTYLWSNGATLEDVTTTIAGSYYLTVTDSNSCSIIGFAVINSPLQISAAITNTSCHGSVDGQIMLTVNGGQAPYSFQWSNSASTSAVTGLAAGAYNVNISDAAGLIITQTYIITQPLALQVSITNTGSNGFISTTTGGTSPYAYLWSNGATSNNIIVTFPGTYHLTVTDSHSCTATASVFESLPSSWIYTITSSSHTILIPSNTVFVNGNPLQSGSFIGVFYTLPAGGLACGGYIIWTGATTAVAAWPDDVMTPSLDGFLPGEAYHWKIWDISTGIQQDAIATYSTAQPNQGYFAINGLSCLTNLSNLASDIIVNYISNNLTCAGSNDGAISLTATGGQTPYNYQWSNGATTSAVSGLAAGTYTVTVSNISSLPVTQSIVITQPAQLNVSISVTGAYLNSTTNGGTAPYIYLWSNGATSEYITTITPGNYTVTVTDSNSCTSTDSASVTGDSFLQISHTTIDMTCSYLYDGQVHLTVTGGVPPYFYHWSNNATTSSITGLHYSTYYVTVTSSDSLIGIDHAIVHSPGELIVNITCMADSGSYTINSMTTQGTPPYSYYWSTGATNEEIITNNVGYYYLTVTDSHSCTRTDSIFATQPSPWTYIYTNNNHVILVPSGSVTINGNPLTIGSYIGVFYSLPAGGIACGGYIAWSGMSNAFSVWGDDDMTPVKDGFSVNEAFQWKIWDISTGIQQDAIATYATTFPNQGYYVINGESGLTSLSNQTSNIIVNNVSNNLTCAGSNDGAISLTVSGGQTPYSFIWSNGATTDGVTGLAAGAYNVTVSDNTGATVIQGYIITQPTALGSNIVVTGSFHLNSTITGGTPPYAYLWSNGATDENIFTGIPGIYYLTVTDANSCSIIVSVSANLPLQITYTSVNVTCNGLSDGQIQLTVTGGQTPYNYLWSNGAITSDLTGLAAGYYHVTVTDLLGTYMTQGIHVTQPTQLQAGINVTGSDTLIASFTGGTPPVTYDWSTGDTTHFVIGEASGIYSVTITDSNGCTVFADYLLPENCNINVSSSISGVTIIGGSDGIIDLTVTGDHPPFTFSWSNGATTEDIYGLSSGLYSVTIGQNDSLCQPVSYTFHLLEPNQNVPLDTLLTSPLDTCLNLTVDSFYITAVSIQGNVLFVTWVFTGNGAIAIFPVTYVFSAYGTYVIVLEISCAKSSVTYTTYINISSHLGVENLSQADIRIYPNPFNGSFNLDLPGVSYADIRIFNAIGQMVFSTKTSVVHQSINASKWPAGIYLVRVMRENKNFITRKVIKQ
ncbi:MAG: choice-of-anchor L domain-containing protein [Bacteroidia bacterium]|nr:choice-of-anchor L domain-containing protein [Bacteroidia bacterium]